MAEVPPPPEGILLTHFIVSDDVERSRRFYQQREVSFLLPGSQLDCFNDFAERHARSLVHCRDVSERLSAEDTDGLPRVGD